MAVIVAVPADTPVTIPVAKPTVAMPVALLLHVPPAVASDNVMTEPTQTLVGPDIGDTGLEDDHVRILPAAGEPAIAIVNTVEEAEVAAALPRVCQSVVLLDIPIVAVLPE